MTDQTRPAASSSAASGQDRAAASGHGKRAPPPRARLALFVLVPAVALLGWGAWQHWQRADAAAETQREAAAFVSTVRVATAERKDDPVTLRLPGQTEAFDSASIYARATGYVAERAVDIGSRVRKGDLLPRIAAPDLDQQLAQAEAQLGQNQAQLMQAQASVEQAQAQAQAQANTRLASVTRYRATTLAAQGWETKQNADNSTANAQVQAANVDSAQAGVKVAEANLKAQLATVQRLRALTAFEQVVAPFDGVVTARGVDAGNLVSADAGTGTPLFTLARDDVIRIAARVPQSGAVGMRDGIAAEVRVPEMPGRVFHGQVARSSVALAAASRTLLVEVDVSNPDGALRPGLYVETSFDIPRERPGVVVPSEALVFNAAGMQVAEVAEDGTVHLRSVSISRDFGATVELRDGLSGGERLALGLPANLGDGARVKVDEGKPEPGKATAQRQERAG